MNKKYLVIILAVLLLFSLMILFGFIRKSSDNNPNLENNLAKENVNSPETLNINVSEILKLMFLILICLPATATLLLGI